jgi:hypothetical protein
LMMKINSEKKKAFIRHLFIKNLMQKLITVKKKKETCFQCDVYSAKIWSCLQVSKKSERVWKEIWRWWMT